MEHYYFRTLEKVTAAVLGTFNSFYVKQQKYSDSDGWHWEEYRVPIDVGTKDKVVREYDQLFNNADVKRYYNVPKMSLVLKDVSKNTEKQTNQLNVIKNSILDESEEGRKIVRYVKNPSWWNANYSLFLVTRRMDDMTQILEQIFPIFQPQYALNIRLIPEINLTATLEMYISSGVSFQVNDELEHDKIRFVNAEVGIIVPVPFFPPITDDKIIKRITLNFASVSDLGILPSAVETKETRNIYGERTDTVGIKIY